MQSNIIELKHIYKSYTQGKKKTDVLEDFSLSVPEGSFTTLLGPSGCGKSTITKIVAGIIPIDKGELHLCGNDYSTGVPQSMKIHIGYVFQWHNLAPWLTVENNLYLPLEMYGFKREKSWNERAEKNLRLVGLEKYKKVYPHELSGGMQQRVGIARSLMSDPDLLIFDQPFGALDAITKKLLADSFSKEMRLEKKSMLMVTNSVDEAVQYSDHICIMSERPGTVKKIIDTHITQEERELPDFWMHEEFLEIKREVIACIHSDKAASKQKNRNGDIQ